MSVLWLWKIGLIFRKQFLIWHHGQTLRVRKKTLHSKRCRKQSWTASIEMLLSCKGSINLKKILDKSSWKKPCFVHSATFIYNLATLTSLWRHERWPILTASSEKFDYFCDREVPWVRISQEGGTFFPWNNDFWCFLSLISSCYWLVQQYKLLINFEYENQAKKKVIMCVSLGSNSGPLAW